MVHDLSPIAWERWPAVYDFWDKPLTVRYAPVNAASLPAYLQCDVARAFSAPPNYNSLTRPVWRKCFHVGTVQDLAREAIPWGVPRDFVGVLVNSRTNDEVLRPVHKVV